MPKSTRFVAACRAWTPLRPAPFVAALALWLLLPPAPVQAGRLAVVARGAGPGSDRAAALVGHYLEEGLAGSEQGEMVAITQALGNPERDRVLRRFSFAEGLYQKARDAFARLDLDEADVDLRGALLQYERHAAYVRDYKGVAETLLLLGGVRILRGDERTGIAYLEQAITVFPEIEPDPRIFNPAMRVQFGQTATRVAARASGTLSLSSAPDAASVFVDGQFVGVTPVVVQNMPEGRHYVRVERPGFRPWGRILQVTGEHEAKDNAMLTPATHFEEYDALVDRAARALADGEMQGRETSCMNLAKLVGADTLILAEVRLDGERVRIVAEQFDAADRRAAKPVQHVFAYDARTETYAREVGVLLRSSFGVGGNAAAAGTRPQDNGNAPAAADPAGARLVAGGGNPAQAGGKQSLQDLRPASTSLTTKRAVAGTLNVVGAGLVVGGVVEWVLAKHTHDSWSHTTQVSEQQLALRRRGRNQAVVGDALMFTGLAVSLAGILTWSLWHPDVVVSDVLRDGPPSKNKHGGGKDGRGDKDGRAGRDKSLSRLDLTVVPRAQGALLAPTLYF